MYEHAYFRAFHARSVIALRTGEFLILQRTLFIFILFASDRLKSFFYSLNPAPCVIPYQTSNIIIVNLLLLGLKGISHDEKRLREISSTARYLK